MLQCLSVLLIVYRVNICVYTVRVSCMYICQVITVIELSWQIVT